MSEIPTDSTNLIIDKNVLDPNKSDIETNFDKLEKFLKLYFTYQKDESGITLMVNQLDKMLGKVRLQSHLL